MGTVRELLNQATMDLVKSGSASARLDAEVLLSTYLKTDRLELFKAPEKSLKEEDVNGFARLLERRSQGEPAAYITGQKEFWSLLFEVGRDVLIPRPETEILVEETLKASADLGRGDVSILEIGVGSGAVSIALAQELPDARLTATDISMAALSLACRNALRHGCDQRIAFCCGSFFDPLSETFDIILSNPPYIPLTEWASLPPGVRDYEPQQALVAGMDGLACHREIVTGAIKHLKKDGWLLLEMGDGQREEVEKILVASGNYYSIEVRRDYGGIERVIKARKRGD